MLALSISDYVHSWQLAPIGLFLAIWLVGGSYLVRGILAKVPELPRSQRSMNWAFQLAFLANGAGLVAMMILAAFAYAIALRTELLPSITALHAGGLAFVAAALILIVLGFFTMAWVVWQTMLTLPGLSLRAMTLRSTGPVLLAGLVLGAVALIPAAIIRQGQGKVGACQAHLLTIKDALVSFSLQNPGRMPASLQDLVSKDLPKDILECPARPGQVGYVYVPAQGGYPKDEKPARIILADKPGNHRNETLFLLSDGLLDHMGDERFANKLNEPQNKDFKAAYEKAK